MYPKILILKNKQNIYVIIVLLEIIGNVWLYVWLGMRTWKLFYSFFQLIKGDKVIFYNK